MTLHKRLFKLNSDGKSVQVWEIHSSDDDTSYWTVSGREDGKKVTTKPTAVKPKVNRTQREQILLEMDSKVAQKRRKKYVDDKKDVGESADDALPGYSAMLAKKWESNKKKIIFPCVVQPKLDGVRCLATKDGFFTRGRKEIEACEHIRDELKPFFKKFPNAQLDGELYSHDMKDDFERIIKAVRKTKEKTTEKDLELQKQIQYHVYDARRCGPYAAAAGFLDRFSRVREFLAEMNINSLIIVETRCDVRSEKEIFEHHSDFLFAGYEGTMIRNETMPYEGKRTHNLLKLKDFDEDEFEIIGVNEGKGNLAGRAGNFVLVTKGGREFKAKLEGSLERLEWLWHHPAEAVGRMATIRFQGITNKEGVPRFPVMKDIRGLKSRADWH